MHLDFGWRSRRIILPLDNFLWFLQDEALELHDVILEPFSLRLDTMIHQELAIGDLKAQSLEIT